MVLDDLDRLLLRLLQEDARRSYRTMAALAHSTGPTVAARIRRMEELGVIRGYSVVVDQPPSPIAREVRVACHTCDRYTQDPVEARIGGRLHPFCCTTCRDTFAAKHDRLSKPRASGRSR